MGLLAESVVVDNLDYPPEFTTSLNLDLLCAANITHRGETLEDMDRQLVRIPLLEEREMVIPLNALHPNPEQPREYFDPVELAKLKASLMTSPQRVAIKAVPCVIKDEDGRDTGEVILMIVDGERRWRVLKDLGRSTAKIIVMYVATAEELLEASLTINEGNAPHNPIERGHAYHRMAEFHMQRNRKLSKSAAYQLIADKLGISPMTVRNHILLLAQPKEIQDLIARGVPPGNLIQLMKGTKEDDEIKRLKVARLLLDTLDKDQGNDANIVHTNSRKGVRAKIRQAMLEGSAPDELKTVREVNTVLAALATVRTARTRMQRVLEEISAARTREILRGRPGNPPEAEQDVLAELEQALVNFSDIVASAIAPEPLPNIPGKPSFSSYAKDHCHSIVHPVRRALVIQLAQASDNKKGQILAARELAPLVDAEVNAVVGHLKELPAELATMGLCLDTQMKRFKDSRHHYDKVPAYRLAWHSSNGLKKTRGSTTEHTDYTRRSRVRKNIDGIYKPLAGQEVLVIERGHPEYIDLVITTKLQNPHTQVIVRLVSGFDHFAIFRSDLDDTA